MVRAAGIKIFFRGGEGTGGGTRGGDSLLLLVVLLYKNLGFVARFMQWHWISCLIYTMVLYNGKRKSTRLYNTMQSIQGYAMGEG